MEVFWQQDVDYQNKVLSKEIKKRVAIEAGSAALWAPFVGSDGMVCGVNDFGHSGPYQQIYEYFGLTPKAIANKLL
jgi:transketolase